MPRFISVYHCYSTLTLMAMVITLFLNWTSSIGISAFYTSGYEEDSVAEFRELVYDIATKEYMRSDAYLLRWLRVYDFDLEKAYNMFHESMTWRKKNNIDHILQEDYTSMDNRYPYLIDGFDKEGHPLVFAPVGTYDIRKIAISGEEHFYQRIMTRMFELMEVYLQEIRDSTGNDNITQVVTIFDLGGFNLKQGGCLRCLELIPELLTNFETNYPGIFYRVYYINTPSIFYNALRIGMNFLSQESKDALRVFGYDKDEWSKALLEQIPPENLPIKYGGIKPNPSFAKRDFRKRNSAVMHLLGNNKYNNLHKSTINYYNHGQDINTTTTTTVPNGSYELNYLESRNSISVTAEKRSKSPIEPDYKPTSWFDSAFTPFDWTPPDNTLNESSNSNVLSFTKAVIFDDSEKNERHPHKQKHHHHHHHHYKKITQSDKYERITYLAGNSTNNRPFQLQLLSLLISYSLQACFLKFLLI